MIPFSVRWRDLALGATIFIISLIPFIVLSQQVRWPNPQNGWSLAITVAAVIALLPLIARTISFLQMSRASFEGPLGIKLDFRSVAAAAAVGTTKPVENLVQPGVYIGESSFKEINESAVKATAQTVVIVNLEDGRAWYSTRLFALAATADVLGAPKALVLLGQRNDQPMQVAGWISPSNLVKALIRKDARFRAVLQHAKAYLYRLETAMKEPDPNFPKLQSYQRSFSEIGAAAFMFILIDQMLNPDAPSTALEVGASPPWLTLAEAESILDPWLVRAQLDLGKPDHEQIDLMMAAKGDVIVATRGGQYSGVIDVIGAERELLRQLIVGPTLSNLQSQ